MYFLILSAFWYGPSMPETTIYPVPPAERSGGMDPKVDQNAAKNPAPSSSKLGTFSGAFVPTTLNIFSILMFLRFGFIIGQAGVLGILGEFVDGIFRC